jgi:hypothetical protein
MHGSTGAGWSSLAARRAHNPKVVGSNPTPATNLHRYRRIAPPLARRPPPSILCFQTLRVSASGALWVPAFSLLSQSLSDNQVAHTDQTNTLPIQKP